MKFGNFMQNFMRITVMWSKSKPEEKFQYGGRLFFCKTEIVISRPWIELSWRYSVCL